MKTFRNVLGGLAVIPLALLADLLRFPPTHYTENSLRTLAFLVLGVPILTLNFWAWQYPEIIEFYFLGHEGKELKSRVAQDINVPTEVGLHAN